MVCCTVIVNSVATDGKCLKPYSRADGFLLYSLGKSCSLLEGAVQEAKREHTIGEIEHNGELL
jgi:hypothetical protein